jgi:5-deoxy-glucuronate isomerase
MIIHPSAPPNHLAPDELRLRPGPDGVSVAVDAARAGWRYLSFRTLALAEGDRSELLAGGSGYESVVVVLAGGGISLASREASLELPGRASVFDGKPWAVYVPSACQMQVSGQPVTDGGAVLIAVAEAPPSGREGVARAPVVIRPEDVEVEIRGAGNATRRIHHIVKPDFPADRLLVVEVYTPAGNWSSWPPHKHDVDNMPHEAVLEEIYYYQLRRPEGWGIQRLYRRDGESSRDALWAVHHGELVLVTDGYHPFAAAHGYDAYYLNALAGDRRTMACSDDPDLAWTRAAWADLEPDPRALA